MTFFEARRPIRRSCPTARTTSFYFLQEVKSFITSPVARPRPQGARRLRNLRHRLFRQRPHRQGDGLGRRRQELGRGGARRSRGCRRPSPASACRGGGTAAPRSCRAGPGTRAATSQPTREQFVARRGQTSKPPSVLGFPEPAFQRDDQLGRRRQGRGEDMSMRKLAIGVVASCSRSGPPLFAESPKLGKPISPTDFAAWDINILPDGSNLPPGSGKAADGAKIFARAVRALPRRQRQGRPRRPPHRRPAEGEPRRRQDHRQYLALCDDAVRLHPPRHAVPRRRARSATRRSMRSSPIILAENKLIGEGEEMNAQDLAQGADAEPRQFHRPVSRPHLTGLASPGFAGRGPIALSGGRSSCHRVEGLPGVDLTL